MKALLSKTPGGPDTLVLQDVPDPAPGKGEIRIAVKACGVNFPDSLIIEDKYQIKPPRPFAPGGEIAGVVDAVGDGVDEALVGKRMIGFIGHGGMAEKVVLDARRAAPMPDAMPFETAAAFIMTYATTIHALKDRAALKAGETLLVLGAAGGVGLAAIELGKAYGAASSRRSPRRPSSTSRWRTAPMQVSSTRRGRSIPTAARRCRSCSRTRSAKPAPT